MNSRISTYYDREAVSEAVRRGRHRELVGGLWTDIGELQFRLIKDSGLRPEMTFLDVGCGCFRGGVHFIRYLNEGNYYGIDVSQELLDVGYDVELDAAGLKHKLPRENLACNSDFSADGFGVSFDIAVAQSVFTHLPLNLITLCLTRLADVVKIGGVFYATVFISPEEHDWTTPLVHAPGGITTYPASDPYHYRSRDLLNCARGLPWMFELVGDWGHPRGQKLVKFTRVDDQSGKDDGVRGLDTVEARSLPPGSAHYRAYVGPPARFDFMSSTQFALLFALGLQEADKVLDIGCGSLRLGRLLVPFLLPGRYFGVDPNAWLISDALQHELGDDAALLKSPKFSSRSDYDFREFEETFDYAVAQSIATHTGPDELEKMVSGAASVLKEDGLFLFSYIRNDASELPQAGWHYPQCVSYSEEYMMSVLAAQGLTGKQIPWLHPAATWIVAARSARRLPNADQMSFLTGQVMER